MKSEDMSKLLSPILLTTFLTTICLLPNEVNAAGSRGISVNLRAAENVNAPVAESVTLYEKSFALVIGNDGYNNGWPKLTNAIKDAELVANELQEKGFDVELHRDLDSTQLNEVFKRFFILKGNDAAARLFVWYAGHGQTLDGEGYLVPVDAPVPSKGAEFKFSALALRDFGTYMRQALSKHAYAVFDSCFAGSVFSSQRAMPPSAITRATTLPVRQFLTSGDADQTVSDDGSFRELFIRAVRGEERSDANGDGYVTASELGMFLGDRVTNLTQSLQTPRYGKLRDKDYDRGDFVFVLPEGAAGAGALELAPKPAPAQASAEITFWNSIQNSDSIGQFDAYLKQYPEGTFAALAMVRKTELQKKLQDARREAQAREKFEVAFLDQDFEAAKRANVRENPFPTADKVAQLEKGALVWAIGETETKGGKWYKVARDGLELGFVYSPLLKETARVDSEVAVEPLPVPEVAVSESQPDEPAAEQPESTQPQDPVDAPTQPASTDQRLSSFVDDLLTPAEKASTESAQQQAAPRVQTSSRGPGGANAARPSSQNQPAGEPNESPGRARQSTSQTERVELVTIASQPPTDASQETTDARLPATNARQPATDASQPATNARQPVTNARQPDTNARQPATNARQTSTDSDLLSDTRKAPDPQQVARAPAQSRSMPATTAGDSTTPSSAAASGAERSGNVADGTKKVEPPAAAEISTQAPVETKVAKVVEEPTPVVSRAGRDAGREGVSPPPQSPPAEENIALLETDTSATKKAEVSDYIKQYIAAAEGGNVRAQASLAYMYETGQQVGVDKQQAIFWYRKAAEKGDIQAQLNLGLMYQGGDGIPQDLTEAAFWYRKAAIQGDPDAQDTLGFMYENGRGLVKDITEAAWWYTKAAEQGKVASQNNLGRLYQLGLGIPKDVTKAIFWYGKAAEQGSEAAKKNLSDLTQ